MTKTTCIIVEDEPHAMQLLEDHISKVPFLELAGKCYDAVEAIAFLKKQQVDLIFLDINMPQISGLELAALIAKDQKIIFTTAYSEYALDSFDYHVVDYLLKPVTFKRFIQSLEKFQLLMTSREANSEDTAVRNDSPGFMFIKSGKQIHKVEFSRILYTEALKEYVCIHTIQEKMLVYKRMKEMAALLPDEFVRIHNSYIINTKYITCIENNMVEIDGKQLPVSSGYKNLFQQKIKIHLV